jgi:uncharacterized membrane protein HdeD (DUF308 family)
MKKGSAVWAVWRYTEAILLLVAGILCIVFSNNSSLQSYIILVIGCFLIVGGALKILIDLIQIFIAKDVGALTYSLVAGGALELALGIVLVSNQNFANVLLNFFATFLGIALIVAGAGFLVFAVAFIIRRIYKFFMPILELLFGGALIAVGVLILVYFGSDEEIFRQVILIIAGIVLLAAGIGLIIETSSILTLAKKDKEIKKETEKAAVEANVTEIDLTSKNPKK